MSAPLSRGMFSAIVFARVGLAASGLAACSSDSHTGDGTGGTSATSGGSDPGGSGAGGRSGNSGTGGMIGMGGSATSGSGGTSGMGGTAGTSDDGGAAGAASTGGTDGGGTTGTAGTAGSGDAGSGGFRSVTDFAEPGPFDVTQTSDGPSCTVHRPTDAELGGPNGDLRHPVITWGNGTGTTPVVYAAVLRHWASHGFIVTAANSTNTGDAVEMLACLEWILEQDAVSGPYQGRVDAAHLGASGHSQGGGGTLMIGRDSRITATAPLQPYILGGLGGFESTSISEQEGPMFLMSGSDDTIARPTANQQPVFDDTNVPVFWGTLQGATHTGTAIGDIGDYRGPATAWFRLHLMGDESARDLFYGDSCGLCNDTSWSVERKGL